MQPDFINFLLILYLIYLSDCIVFARSTELMLFSRMRGAKWRVKSTESAMSIGRRFWMLRPLLLPLGSSHRLLFPRYSLGHDGVCSGSPLSRSARMGGHSHFVAYDAVESVEIHEDTLVVNGVPWFQGAKAELIEAKDAVESIAGSDDRRAAIRRWIEAHYEAGRVASDRIEELESQTVWLNLFCSAYAIWLLLFLPVGLFFFSPIRLLWVVGVPILLFHLICGGLFLRMHVKLLPAERPARWETFFKMFLCPPMMIRACDPLADHAGVAGDAVAVLLAMTNEKIWRAPIQQVWRCLIPGKRTAVEADVAKTMNEYAAIYQAVMKQVLTDQGVDSTLFEVDATDVPDDHRYCPCCATIYRSEIEECSDCGDIPLLAGRGGSHVS